LNEGKENSTETAAIFAGTGSEIAMPRKKDFMKNATVPVAPKKVQFSEDKIAKMREFAQRLSKQITEKNKGELDVKTEKIEIAVKEEPVELSLEIKENDKKKKDKKHRKKKGAKFEGERVLNLVKQGEFADFMKEQKDQEIKPEHQDDYVLRKLFKKSGKY